MEFEKWSFDCYNYSPLTNACCYSHSNQFLWILMKGLFYFKIKRLPGAHAATVVLPAIAMIMLTLTSFWIDPNNSDRLLLASVNLIVAFLYQQYISWMISLRGHNIPLIHLFARDSLLLVSFTIVFAVISKNMLSRTTPLPIYLARGIEPGKYILLAGSLLNVATKGQEDGEAILNNSEVDKTPEQWSLLVAILNQLCFLAYCITYLIMFVNFVL